MIRRRRPFALPRADVEMTPAKRLRWRLGDALRDPDQRRLLISLAGRPDGPVECRQFQRALHRLKTPRYNAALTALINGGFLQRVTRDGVGCLVLPAEVRHLISEVQIGVRRAPSARAMRERARRGTSAAGTAQGQPSRQAHPPGTKSRRRYQPRPVPDRRRFPAAWGRSLSAKRAGKARQRQARAAGICPTDAPNAARRAKRAEQERRQAAEHVSTTYGASGVSSPGQRVPDDTRPLPSPSSTTVALSAAYRTLAPVGRDARLSEARKRR